MLRDTNPVPLRFTLEYMFVRVFLELLDQIFFHTLVGHAEAGQSVLQTVVVDIDAPVGKVRTMSIDRRIPRVLKQSSIQIFPIFRSNYLQSLLLGH
jgi:hypothetical protein